MQCPCGLHSGAPPCFGFLLSKIYSIKTDQRVGGEKVKKDKSKLETGENILSFLAWKRDFKHLEVRGNKILT